MLLVCRERFAKPLRFRLRHAQMNLLESLIRDKEVPFSTLLMLADIVNEHREALETVAKQLSEMPRTEDSPTEEGVEVLPDGTTLRRYYTKSRANYNNGYDDAVWREFEQMDESELVWVSNRFNLKAIKQRDKEILNRFATNLNVNLVFCRLSKKELYELQKAMQTIENEYAEERFFTSDEQLVLHDVRTINNITRLERDIYVQLVDGEFSVTLEYLCDIVGTSPRYAH